MNTLIPSNGGQNEINGLDIQYSPVVIFDFKTLEILSVTDNYTYADEISCDFYRKGIDARFEMLKFWDEKLNSSKIIGMKMNQFQFFVEEYNYPNQVIH